MKLLCIWCAIFVGNLSLGTYALGSNISQHDSLQNFCIAEKKDTPENCECGQATANEIMSPKEQAMALALMQGDRKVVSQLGENHDAFMDKLSQITKGCTKTRTN